MDKDDLYIIGRLVDINHEHINEIEKLKAENKKLREALEFYADTNNWCLNTINPCDQDHVIGGLLARKVLKELGDE